MFAIPLFHQSLDPFPIHAIRHKDDKISAEKPNRFLPRVDRLQAVLSTEIAMGFASNPFTWLGRRRQCLNLTLLAPNPFLASPQDLLDTI